MSENYNDYISRTYPAVRYVDDADKDTDELCMKCKGDNCGFIGMIGFWACHGFIPKEQEAQR